MSDLISRSELLKRFTFNSDGKRIPEYDVDNFPTTVSISTVKSMIREMPTAFDLDKIIAELQKLKTYKLDLADTMTEIMARGKSVTYICLEDVIELLKNNLFDTAESPKTD